MSFGSELQKTFQSLTQGQKLNEVKLFTKLQDSFQILKSSYPNHASAIIHGRSSFVSFVSRAEYVEEISWGQEVTRELGDLMLVVVSPSRDIARLTYLQIKYKNQIQRRRGYSLYLEPNTFKGDLVQLELMNSRPEITVNGKASSALKEARCPSVCSYGVFYDNGCHYEMKYYSAHLLSPRTDYAKSKIRDIIYEYEMDVDHYNKTDLQYNSCSDLEVFGNAVISLEIGTPMRIEQIMSSVCNNKVAEKMKEMMLYSDRGPEQLSDGNQPINYFPDATSTIILNADFFTGQY